MIGWRALNFVWFGKRKIAVHAAKTTLLNTIYMSITCRKYVTNSMTWWIYPRVFWFPRGRPRGKKTPGYPVDLRLTLGYRQICSKLKKCATPGKLAKIPGGTPGYMALKSTKTTSTVTSIIPKSNIVLQAASFRALQKHKKCLYLSSSLERSGMNSHSSAGEISNLGVKPATKL
jgi:hypothetical protein